jgi:DNA-directed RNA polymerase sigma subunit (sigma70/sigma32)
MKEDKRIDPRPTPSEVVDKILASQEIRRILITHLKPRESFVLMERFGFNHPEPITLKDLGKQLGICGGRVRSLEYKAIRILQNKHSRRLAELYPSFSS